jgi:hypothetical protein
VELTDALPARNQRPLGDDAQEAGLTAARHVRLENDLLTYFCNGSISPKEAFSDV